ncbi:LytTR family transcriptional regulator DNA-binding domain-containing protein [Saccharibacillus sp. CPCC 101409]|uniref:LytR/AlgR family response regulator transcription factor n=1 Tax=Saccharibacillus sp. CPCC 101409 TaxID=3058041 RepID=UPI002670D0B3|nr:LytTR family DNA-binding domain-containing protein [Saccharibacillus sp. CPCC 101409]MDO3408219.1 LytTR family transcriptional regulator DNA-binding domain-containing protein [Saccharibacillus sp. CPCC 101409]
MENVVELMERLKESSGISALLLDSEMPGLFETREWEAAAADLPVVLLAPKSAYLSYRGSLNIFEFIEKPVTAEKLEPLIWRLTGRRAGTGPLLHHRMGVPVVGDKIVRLAPSEILFVEARGSEVIVHTRYEQWPTRISFETYRSYLREDHFVLTHPSFLINMLKVGRVDRAQVHIEGSEQPVPVAIEALAEVRRKARKYAASEKSIRI